MSTFGGPGGRQIISKPSPPERGSFPLDHDAECQPLMKQYLKCIRGAKGVNSEECRRLSQGYLNCRMERNLMARDSMRNLGFGDLSKEEVEERMKGDGKEAENGTNGGKK